MAVERARLRKLSKETEINLGKKLEGPNIFHQLPNTKPTGAKLLWINGLNLTSFKLY